MRIHTGLDQRIQSRVDHGGRTAGIDMHLIQVSDIFADRFMQQPTASFPTAQITHHLVQEKIRQLLPFGPMLDLVEVLGSTHAPIQVNRMLEALGAAMLDQTVHLAHAGTGGDQYQRAVRQLRQMGIAEGHLHPGDAGVLELRKLAHRTVDSVGREIEGLRFNRAVAQIYELANGLQRFAQSAGDSLSAPQREAFSEGIERLVQLVAPMMPHLAETCWQALGKEGLVADAPWPAIDPAMLVEDSVTLAVQVNGKLRGTLALPVGLARAEIEKRALGLEPVEKLLEGRAPKKVIIVPDRIVNVVV